MTTLTLFLALNDESYDPLMDGIEEEIKRLVKATRELQRKGVEKE